jgi:hypothetical protein
VKFLLAIEKLPQGRLAARVIGHELRDVDWLAAVDLLQVLCQHGLDGALVFGKLAIRVTH